MAASVSEDAGVFTFWPDRKQPRPGLRPARGIAMRQTTIRPFKIVKDWSSPASSQHDDDDDKREPDTRVSSKVSQSPSIQGSPASVAHPSPQPGSLPEPEEPTLTDINASVPEEDPSQRRKSGRAPKARQEWWKASPDVGSNSNAVRSTGRKRQERSSSLLPDDSDSASVTTTRKKNQQNSQPEESDSSAVRNTGKKRRQRSSSFPPDDSDSVSASTTRKKNRQNNQPEESDSSTVRNTGKKRRQKSSSLPPDDSDSASTTTTRKKKQRSVEPSVSNSSTVRKTGKKRQQKSSSLLPDDSNSEPATITRKKKQQSIEPAVSESDSSEVQTTGKKKRQRRQSFLPDESDSSSVETTEKKRQEKGSSQAVDSDSRSVRSTRKRRQHSIEPEDYGTSSVRTTNKKKRQSQQSFQSDESDLGATRTTGKKKRQQTQQSSLSSKNKAEKTRPSSQRTPLLVPDVHVEESIVSSESSMRRTRRVSKPSTEWWRVTEINGSVSRNGVSSSPDENQPQGFGSGVSSGSSSSSGGYRGMKTPRTQGQGGASNLVSGVSRRVISKRPPIPPRHAGNGNRAKGQTVYQWNAGGLERNLGDLSDLDILLTMIEDLTQQYQDSCGNLTESAVCKEMMTQFRDKVIGAIQRKIDLVHKYKFDQSRLRRMDLTIKQRRSELLSLQREDIRLDQQLDQLQKKLTGSTERDQILQKTSTVLQDLQELQQKYMDSAK